MDAAAKAVVNEHRKEHERKAEERRLTEAAERERAAQEKRIEEEKKNQERIAKNIEELNRKKKATAAEADARSKPHTPDTSKKRKADEPAAVSKAAQAKSAKKKQKKTAVEPQDEGYDTEPEK